MTLAQILDADPDQRFTVDGWRGIAFYFDGLDTAADDDTAWTGIYAETGYVRMVMVGDDRVHIIDPDDVSLLDGAYCPECGQIGCTAYDLEDR